MDEAAFAWADIMVHATSRLADDYGSPQNPTHPDLEAWTRRAVLEVGSSARNEAVAWGVEGQRR